MITTKNLATDINEVPQTYIFERYCNLKEKLTGQNVRIKSMFNPSDTKPSMFIYYDKHKNTYKFKDFSSGHQGSAIDLVKLLKNKTFSEAVNLIINEYNNQNESYKTENLKEHPRFKVTEYEIRNWTKEDSTYWLSYNIGSSLLKRYNVYPLEGYVMSKPDKSFHVSGNYIYGYFTKDGELYKVYQPKKPDKKFIKVKSYLQGSEQLNNKDYLVITSSLKDIMTTASFNLNLDLIAPDSENSFISDKLMKQYLSKYKKVLVMFDNDDAGMKAMGKYKEKYNIPHVYIGMEKDISDSVKKYGPAVVMRKLVVSINSKLNELDIQ